MNAIAATPAAAPRKEAAGIVKRSSAFFADPRTITRTPGFNARYDMGEIEELASSIKANGLLQPLRVKRAAPDSAEHGAGKNFVLIDGDRRLHAIELLLKQGEQFADGVQIIIVDKSQSSLDDLIQMFVANTGKPFLPLEEAAAYKRMQDAGMTVKQICAAVGRKHMHVTEILALVGADESVKEAVKSGAIGKTMAKQIASTAKGDKELQAKLVQQAVGAKDKGTRAAVKKSLDEQRRAKAAAKGRTLKIRALSDEELSAIGAKLAARMTVLMEEAKKPLDFDIRDWVKKDEDLALAATFGALEALKAAAGMTVDLEF